MLPNKDENCDPTASETTALLDHPGPGRRTTHSLVGTGMKPVASSRSTCCRNEPEKMVEPVRPTYTGISVTTDEDVHVLLGAVKLGKLNLVQERPTKDQQAELVQSGNCFIFDETLSRIIRWTDGRRWGSKKVQGKFTVCSEAGSLGTESRFMKHTYRVQLDEAHYHVIAYSQEHSPLTPACKDQRLRALARSEDAVPLNTDAPDLSSETENDMVAGHTDLFHEHSFDSSHPATPVNQEPWVLFNSIFKSGNSSPRSLSQATIATTNGESGQDSQADYPHSRPYTTEYFRAFVEACPHLWNLPTQLTDLRSQYLHQFLLRVAPLHTKPDSACFAATETFALDHEGTPSVLAFLAVLREQFDMFRPEQNVDSAIRCRNELSCEYVILPISNLNTSTAPPTWLAIQTLGSHFRSERLKRAAWALGQLPPGSHASDSSSFKWVRQTWNRLPLRSGSRQVVDLHPGDSRQQWPLLRRLKTRLYHPANLALNSELMGVLDEDLRRACTNSLQEWCIALTYQLSKRPSEGSRMIVDLHCDYMVRVTELQIDAFSQTGNAHVLHNCMHNPCHHPKPSLDDVKIELIRTLKALADSLVQSSVEGQFLQQYSYPNSTQWHYASLLGLQCYWLQASYILLSPAERLIYDCVCRTGLNTFRAELTEKLAPGPVLIWNYLPDDVQAWAAREREAMETSGY